MMKKLFRNFVLIGGLLMVGLPVAQAGGTATQSPAVERGDEMTAGELSDTAPRGPGMETDEGGASVVVIVGGAVLAAVLLGVIIRALRKRTSQVR